MDNRNHTGSGCAVLSVAVLVVLLISVGGAMRGCSNDIDGTETFTWWAW